MGETWFNSVFSLLVKLTKTEVLICSRYVDADSQRYSYKNMLQNYAANLHKGVPAGAFPHKLNACSFTIPLIALLRFHLLNCKALLQVVWIPQWYFVTYATKSINIGTFKMFNKVLTRNFKSHKFQKMKQNCIPKILWYLFPI